MGPDWLNNLFKGVVGLLLCLPLLSADLAVAGCSEPNFTDPSRLQIRAKEVLVVTHASNVFDPRYATKYGLDNVVRFAKEKKIPVVYLADDSPIQTYFADDCSPDYWVRSIDGDINFLVDVDHIYLAGGHVELCLSRSIHDFVTGRPARPQKADGDLCHGCDLLERQNRGRGRSVLQRFHNVSQCGDLWPGGERWPKLTLLEATGVIKRLEWDYMYLKELLPRWDRTFSNDYRVELQMDEFETRVLRRGVGPGAPTIKFHFIDSADLIR